MKYWQSFYEIQQRTQPEPKAHWQPPNEYHYALSNSRRKDPIIFFYFLFVLLKEINIKQLESMYGVGK